MALSFGEILALQDEFESQCTAMGVVWTDKEVEGEALNQFISDYEDGNEDPKVMLCGYGYKIEK